MLGCDEDLEWHQEDDQVVIDRIPETLPCNYAWTFKMQLSDILP